MFSSINKPSLKYCVRCLYRVYKSKEGRNLIGSSFCNKEQNVSRLCVLVKVFGELCKRIWKEGKVEEIKGTLVLMFLMLPLLQLFIYGSFESLKKLNVDLWNPVVIKFIFLRNSTSRTIAKENANLLLYASSSSPFYSIFKYEVSVNSSSSIIWYTYKK